jgi:hypothetical protein
MLNMSVSGDARGGYMVDVHDGDKHAVYHPEGIETDQEALALALKEHDPDLSGRLAKGFGGGSADMKAAADLRTMTAERDSLKGEVAKLTADLATARRTAALTSAGTVTPQPSVPLTSTGTITPQPSVVVPKPV